MTFAGCWGWKGVDTAVLALQRGVRCLSRLCHVGCMLLGRCGVRLAGCANMPLLVREKLVLVVPCSTNIGRRC